MATAKAETHDSDEEQSAKDRGAAGAVTAPEKRANRENGAPIEQQAATAGEHAASELARILVVDQSLAENLTQTIMPVVREVSDGLLRAVQPVLHEYQDDVAQAMEEQVRRAFPQVDRKLPAGTHEDGEQASAAAGGEEASDQATQNDASVRLDRAGKSAQPERTASDGPSSEGAADTTATTNDDIPGGTDMASEAVESKQSKSDKSAQNGPKNDRASENRPSGQESERRSDMQLSAENKGRAGSPNYLYDPQAAARAGLFRLASDWKEAGSTYQAMHAYMEVLIRYPQTGAAAAATEGLVDLANRLQKEGKFYAALNIYDKLDAML